MLGNMIGSLALAAFAALPLRLTNRCHAGTLLALRAICRSTSRNAAGVLEGP
jgi:hypothetical protein